MFFGCFSDVSRLAEVGAEAVQAALGGQALLADPLGGERERIGCQLVSANAADFGRANDANGLEHSQVLDDARERHVEGAREVRHGSRALGEAFDHSPPARVCERVEHAVELHKLLR